MSDDRIVRTPTSVREIAELVREAAATSRAVAIRGAGAWPLALDRMHADATPLSTSALTGILEYVPGDLTLTARAGTTIAEIDDATRANDQWCPLYPWGTDAGTLGATFATATTGPFRAALGAPRDVALGLEFVDGTAATARGGGRVVKNVAGFDLTRLMVGAWGTLGIITEISVRLRARPAVDRTFAVRCDESDGTTRERIEQFRRGPYLPLACETLAEGSAAVLGLDGPCLLVRVGGNRAFVDESVRRLGAIGALVEHETTIWTRYRALDPHARHFTNALVAPLAARVKAQFDPRGVLNPGVLGEVAR